MTSYYLDVFVDTCCSQIDLGRSVLDEMVVGGNSPSVGCAGNSGQGRIDGSVVHR